MRVYGRLFTALVCRVKRSFKSILILSMHAMRWLGERVRENYLCVLS